MIWLRRLARWPFRRRAPGRRGSEGTDPAMVVPASVVVTEGYWWAMGATDRGRVRPNNEDDFLCAPARRLFAVCDGMGGHAAGEVASRAAVEVLDAALRQDALTGAIEEGEDAVERLLCGALQQANDRLVSLAQEHPEWSGMASAAVVCALDREWAYLANLGDCRAYRVGEDQADLLTTDHSVAASLAAQGQLTAEQARRHPLRNHLTASLGLPGEIAPAFRAVAVAAGDRVVVCSDGLWDALSDARIGEITRSGGTAEEAVKDLVAAANQAGGSDNITVIVVHIGGEEPPLQDRPAPESECPEATDSGVSRPPEAS